MNATFPPQLLKRLQATRLVAAFSIDRVESAVPVARALRAGGVDAIELTLRTPAAVEALKAIADGVPEMLIGAGTVLTPESVVQVEAAGAHFGVSPGLNRRVVSEAQARGLPFAPGIATPSELETAIELGCRVVKFFPAEGLGGTAYLQSMAAPYRHLGIKYFALGGLNPDNIRQYLDQSDVVTVGGTWIVFKELVEKQDWAGISARADEARRLVDEHRATAAKAPVT